MHFSEHSHSSIPLRSLEFDSTELSPARRSALASKRVSAVLVQQRSNSDLQLVIIGFFNGIIRVFTPKYPMQEIRVRMRLDDNLMISTLAISADQRVLAVQTNRSARVLLYYIKPVCHGTGSRKMVHEEPFDELGKGLFKGSTSIPPECDYGHTMPIEGLCFSPQHKELLVTCAYDRTVRFWNLRSDQSAKIWRRRSSPRGHSQLSRLLRQCENRERDCTGLLRSMLCYVTSAPAVCVKSVCEEKFLVALLDGSIDLITPCSPDPVRKMFDSARAALLPIPVHSTWKLWPNGRVESFGRFKSFERAESFGSLGTRHFHCPRGGGEWACLAFNWVSGSLLLFKLPEREAVHGSSCGSFKSWGQEPRELHEPRELQEPWELQEPRELCLQGCPELANKICTMVWFAHGPKRSEARKLARGYARKTSQVSSEDAMLFSKEYTGQFSKEYTTKLSKEYTREDETSTADTCIKTGKEYIGVITAVSSYLGGLDHPSSAYWVVVEKSKHSGSDRVEFSLQLERIASINAWTMPRVTHPLDRVFTTVALQPDVREPVSVRADSPVCEQHKRKRRDRCMRDSLYDRGHEAVTLCALEHGLGIMSTSEAACASIKAAIRDLPGISSVFCSCGLEA